ncbi:MAG: universal stress protein [Bacteroidota bacterium]
MNKILVPFDFSDVAMNALNFAVQLTKQNDSCELVVLNVIEHPTPSSFKTMGVTDYDPLENIYLKKLIDSVEAKLEELLTQEPYQGIKAFYKLKIGNPYHEISFEINEEKAELVVMGTAGASGADEYFVGSNAERVVRRAQCPVITLREPSDVAEINDIVFASNFHDMTPNFVDHVLKLQKALDAELKIVKINTPANFTTTRHDHELMDDFVKRFDIKNCSTSIYNYTNEEDGIVAFAEDIDADMIALGTHQRTGVGHFLLGSIAEDVVNHAKRPVWTFNLEH